jgi:sialate O-acetylesterase
MKFEYQTKIYMKRFALRLLLTILITQTFFAVTANIRLPAIIGSHMVLQQNSEVKIWGWSDPGEKVTISSNWDTATYNTTGSSGAKWTCVIKTPVAGGPYKLTIAGHNTITLEDVLIGEVWDCSGQSNMEMSYSWGVKQYTADADNATNKSIRFFHIPRLTADYPQEDTKGQWVVCNPEDMKQFSLAGYFFGQKLQQTLSIPVGLIDASWGGTPAEAWTSLDSINGNPVLKEAAHHLTPNPGWPVIPAATYNAMIYPITNFTIAGVIWYQGEANVSAANSYQLLLTTMINTWRKVWQKDFPFYYVQIAPFSGYDSLAGALLREAQTKTQAVPNTGMIVINDLVTDVKDIHPKNKKDVGFRLANYALAEVYGKKDVPYKSPMYKSMKIEKGKVRVYFDNADNGLVSKNGQPTDFYLAGADKIFMPASAKIDGKNVIVWNKNIPNPVAVRFGFTSASMPNLFSKEGLPVNTFRSDDWDNVSTLK